GAVFEHVGRYSYPEKLPTVITVEGCPAIAADAMDRAPTAQSVEATPMIANLRTPLMFDSLVWTLRICIHDIASDPHRSLPCRADAPDHELGTGDRRQPRHVCTHVPGNARRGDRRPPPSGPARHSSGRLDAVCQLLPAFSHPNRGAVITARPSFAA